MNNTELHILLIEDNVPDAHYLQDMLWGAKNPAFSLYHAVRLSDGLERLRSGKIDAVLLDLGLPDSQGMNTLVSVRNQSPKLPIIVMTGLADEEFAVEAIKTGADDYLMKGQINDVLLARTIRYTIERKRVEDALRMSEERYRTVLEAAQDAIFNINAESRIILVNKAAGAIFGYSTDEMLGKSLTMLMPENLRERHGDAVKRWVAEGKGLARGSVELPGLHKDGREIPLEITYGEFRREGTPFFIGVVRDITERRKAQEALMRSNAILKQAGQMANLGAWEIEDLNVEDLPANRLTWSDQVYRIFGFRPGEVEVTKGLFLERVHPDDRRKVEDAFEQALGKRQPYNIEHRIIRLDGAERIVIEKAEISFDQTGKPVRVVGTVQDITEQKKAEETIRFQAFHDLLTGLPNRSQLMMKLDLELAEADRNRTKVAVLHVNLDRFRAINESLGHAAGDRVIKNVAAKLKGLIRKSDTIARTGGDEFIIVLTALDRAEDAAVFAASVGDAMRHSMRLNGHEIYTTASIGISIYPEDSGNGEVLLKYADMAVDAAKKQGRNTYQFFNPAISTRTIERLLLESNLRQSIERSELTLHYQPQFSISTRRIIAFEALVRWKHPDLGLLAPSRFIPVAEEMGFITAIDGWVTKAACAQLKAWKEKSGMPAVCMTVNMSSQQFQQPELLEQISGVLRETGVAAPFLEIEITESTAMQDVEVTVPRLSGLREMGVNIVIDDFGTGYSSLNYLKRFPVKKLKIDQSFIRGVPEDPDDRAIVNAVIAMGHNLRLNVIAEGVETEEQLSFLQANGCDEMQGFLFSEPVPADEAGELLLSSREGR